MMQRLTLVLAASDAESISALEGLIQLLPPALTCAYNLRHICYRTGESFLYDLDTIGAAVLRDAMVVCDLGGAHPDPWNVRQLGLHGAGIAAHLVLAFPEVYFVFLGGGLAIGTELAGADPSFSRTVRLHHFVPWPESIRLGALLAWHQQGFRTIFDATALRSHLKRRLIGAETHVEGDRGDFYTYLSDARLKMVAAVADEEQAFTFLNGYAVYRAGIRAWILGSGKEFRRVLPKSLQERKYGPERLNLIVTDWDLAFSDCEEGSHSNAMISASGLYADEPVLLITSFVEHDTIKDYILRTNEARAEKPYGKKVKGFEKQYGSIHVFHQHICDAGLNLPRRAVSASHPNSIPSDRHALPNARRIIVERLLERASALRVVADASVADEVHCALLALEAKEILGGLSLTTYHAALAMQHEAEVAGEVVCFGTATRIDVKARIAELQDETGAIMEKQKLYGGHLSFTSAARLSFLAHVTNRLRKGFAADGQVAAAEQSLQAFAQFQRALALITKKKVWTRIGLKASQYVDWATEYGTSVQKLMAVNAGVVLLMTVLYALVLWPVLAWTHAVPAHHAAGYAFGQSLFTFVELQPGLSEVDGLVLGRHHTAIVLAYRLLVMLELTIAYLHLGLLVSMLYRRLIRQAP